MNPAAPLPCRAAACLLFLLAGADPLPAADRKPNIVFFLADDLGFMDIGANNPKTFYETPNIDGLAAKGMRFRQGYAACPVCSPTRASILTGKYPARVGVTDFIGGAQPDRWDRPTKLLPAAYQEHLALEEVTLAEALRDAGYANFFAGKWHLGDGEFAPGAQGFGPDLQGKNQFYFPADSPPADPRTDPKATDRIADAAVRFIETNKDRPFFAYLPFQAVHIKIGAKPELVKKYQRKQAAAPPVAWGAEGASKVRLVQNHAAYAAMLEQMDTAIGRVLAALERTGLADRTVVVFMSDNGGLATAEGHPTSNLPLRAGKGWLYEGGIREPMIIRAPGVTQAGGVCDTPVTSTDFYPTLLELAGLPARPAQHVDGISLVPLLKGGSLARGPLFWHYPRYGNQGGAPGGVVRDGDWKLIEWYEKSAPMLFNLRADPEERHNLAAGNPAKVTELQGKLAAWRKEVGAVMPTPNPKFKPAADPSLAPIKDEPGLPRVLLIGDSISMGYTVPVRALLQGKANLHRIPTNGGSTKDGLANIESWLGRTKWDVIHFNWGLHDLKHWQNGQLDPAGPQVATLAEYETNLRALVKRLQATGAKLIWASTTPVPDGSAGRTAGDEAKYNEVARRVMTDLGVPTNDLHAACQARLAAWQLPKNVHFNTAGSAGLAAQVAAKIEAALK